MNAANIVSTGDLNVQVPVLKSEGDLAQLGETFNKMTAELRTQRDELVSASGLIDSRRRFIEAVLSSASAGIIGVDGANTIRILNRSAEKLIGHSELGNSGASVVRGSTRAERTHADGEGRNATAGAGPAHAQSGRQRAQHLGVRSVLSKPVNHVTVTSLHWTISRSGDRAAHVSLGATWRDEWHNEIKNPLTPIQLSAERIRRKFGKAITQDKPIFEQCTDTIVRQVEDIRRMVDEFSRFARMPKPVMEGEDVADTVRQTVFLMRVGHPEIDIEADIKHEPMRAQFDRRLISQALTNIIKNAAEAIEAVPPEILGKGRIDVIAAREEDDIVIDVIDNGVGLPKVARARLLEPYERHARRAPALV